MPLFEDNPEQKDFRHAFRKFVAAEITPHREEWEKQRREGPESFVDKKIGRVFSGKSSGRFLGICGERWGKWDSFVHGCRRNMAD